MSTTLSDARLKQEILIKQISQSEQISNQRPLFHFATPGGWCNDPNGFSQFQDKIHLFYQYHPYSTQWGPMHWGHAVSSDMLSWNNLPVALAPDTEADSKGCFSGTAVEHNGKHLLAYTGVSSDGKIDIQNQCIATGDGINYTKSDSNPVITAANIPFEYNKEHFRDPKIWKTNDTFYMACVLKKKNNCGAIALFKSENAVNWTYINILDYSKDGLSAMWECPDISSIDGNDVLIFSPQEVRENTELGFHNGNNSIYAVGKLNYTDGTFTRNRRPENDYTAALVDYGIDFYAPETTKLKDGRTIMIAWMQAWESYITPQNYIWSGMMTIPRELSIKNNRLYQTPIREFENWKTEKQSSTIPSQQKIQFQKNILRHFQLDINLGSSASGFFKLKLSNEGENIFTELNLTDRTILFDRQATKNPGAIPSRKTKLSTDEKIKNMKIICDTCSIEIFINDGTMAFTNIFYFTSPVSDLIFENGTDGVLTFDFWKIKNPQN